MQEPVIALAATPRDWAQRLHRHVADHGGARVRATVLHPQDALAERYDVFVVDDTTSFCTRHLLDELRRRGHRVLGVYDPDDPAGKSDLLELGADDAIDRFASAEQFLTAIGELAARAGPDSGADDLVGDLAGRSGPDAPPPVTSPVQAAGRITAVGGPPGGCGATEVAIALAALLGARSGGCALVDADEVAPSLAQRLGLALYPNLRAAVDALQHRSGSVDDALLAVPGGRFALLAGLSNPRDWQELRPAETLDVVGHLARSHSNVVVNVGHRVEELPGVAGPPRYGQTRALLGAADAIVGVGLPTPVGVARLLEWIADVRAIAAATPIHLVINRTPPGPFKRDEVERELCRSFLPASLSFLPEDPRVGEAAWAGGLVCRGSFAKAAAGVAGLVVPELAATGRRPRTRGGRR
ncbi:MAG TPA: hypothetical protein VG452_00940 [Egibacteraceae bacterium]|nr:hypothetical protein [Egibacteraceae bacterium]